MEDRVQVLLDEVIESEFRKLKTTVKTEERSTVIEELTQLHKMRIEEAKIEVAKVEACTAQENNRNQQKSQNLDRWVNVALQGGLTVGSWIAFTLWQKSEQRFELTGTPSTPIFRNLLSRMTPTLKK